MLRRASLMVYLTKWVTEMGPAATTPMRTIAVLANSFWQ